MNQLLAAMFLILSATINAQEPGAGVNQALLTMEARLHSTPSARL